MTADACDDLGHDQRNKDREDEGRRRECRHERADRTDHTKRQRCRESLPAEGVSHPEAKADVAEQVEHRAAHDGRQLRSAQPLVGMCDDELVADGTYRSRATAVERALFRELRRALALRDLEILARTEDGPEPDDLDALAAWGSRQPMDID